MGKPYKNELKSLPITYEWAKAFDITELVKVIQSSYDLPLISIGSGGSFSAAEFHASLHRYFIGTLAEAMTPMELPIRLPRDGRVAIWFLSASGNNVDICRSFRHAILSEAKVVSALIGRTNSKLSKLGKKFEYSNIFEHSFPVGKDGFLATNSLFGFATLLTKAYSNAAHQVVKMPESLEELLALCLFKYSTIDELQIQTEKLWRCGVLHVIYSPALKSAATDIESKFVEAGLGSVHLADIRNFAHGRHHWFAKNKERQGILCLTSEQDARLGEKTLSLLPEHITKLNVTMNGNSILNQLAGLLLSILFAGWKGEHRKIDPGKPGVPDYGSKIYHLKANAGFLEKVSEKNIAIQRKIRNSCFSTDKLANWSIRYEDFVQKLTESKFGGLVLDFDGTMVDARYRRHMPVEGIISVLIRLLESGIRIGFATGRGKSVRETLAQLSVFPEKYWSRILIGYYNGGEIAPLSDEGMPIKTGNLDQSLAAFLKILREQSIIDIEDYEVTERPKQITVEAKRVMPKAFILDLLQAHALHTGSFKSKIVRSSHSIDILTQDVTKLSVVDKIQRELAEGLKVLTIGDCGKWPGNDYELLNTEFSLSVDEVSSNPNHCWNLCPAGIKGPQGVLSYFGRFDIKEKYFKFSSG